MPYTPTAAAYIDRLARLEPGMPYFHVLDQANDASHGSVWADSPTHAKDRVVGQFGWESYAQYVAANANHSGTRTLEAIEIQVWK